MADSKLITYMNAVVEATDAVFKKEIVDPVGFILVAVNLKDGECGYISNIAEIGELMDLMKQTVERYESIEKNTKKH